MILSEATQALPEHAELVLARHRHARAQSLDTAAARGLQRDGAHTVVQKLEEQVGAVVETRVGDREVEAVGERLAQVVVIDELEAGIEREKAAA